MTKEDFKKVIKIMSHWRIDKRRGNYKLPSKERLSVYLESLINKFLVNNGLALDKNLNARDVFQSDEERYLEFYQKKEIKIFIPFGEDEISNYMEQDKRINMLIRELIGH